MLVRPAILAVGAILLLGLRAEMPQTGDLQGKWQVTSVYRDGESDATQVGGILIFAGGRVVFEPKAVQELEVIG